MKTLFAVSFLALALALVAGHVHADTLAGDSSHGESLFDHHCSACHSMTANRVGPILSGVFGRKAGSVPGFNYSKAVQASGITWNADTIDKWLTNPQQLIPGQRMNFNISDPQKRADIIAYLKTASDAKK
jgi:cytochrome c